MTNINKSLNCFCMFVYSVLPLKLFFSWLCTCSSLEHTSYIHFRIWRWENKQSHRTFKLSTFKTDLIRPLVLEIVCVLSVNPWTLALLACLRFVCVWGVMNQFVNSMSNGIVALQCVVTVCRLILLSVSVTTRWRCCTHNFHTDHYTLTWMESK